MAFVVVKLKAFKVFRTDSASMEWPLLGGFRVLTPLIWSKFAKILTRDSTLASKNILKYWGFYGKGTDPKFALLIRGFLLTMAEIEKIRNSQDNLQPLSYPNMSKSRLYLLSSFRERYGYFLHYLCYFWQENKLN